MDSWGDIIDAANNEDFVGREEQLDIFRRENTNPKPIKRCQGALI